MSVKEKIKELREKLKKRTVNLSLAAVTVLQGPTNASATVSASAPKDKNISPIETLAPQQSENLQQENLPQEEMTLGIGELKNLLQAYKAELPLEALENIEAGPSWQKAHSILSKGFSFTTRNSRGEVKKRYCGLNRSPQGACAGAIKRLLNKVYGIPISGNLSAYQEKDHLLETDKFLSLKISIKDVKRCPLNTVVVIPKCTGHPHGHILTVAEEGIFCSDGREKAGKFFENNYKDAKEVYAFIPTDGSIKLTPELLQSMPQLQAAFTPLKKDTRQIGFDLLTQTNKVPHPATLIALNNMRRPNGK